MNKLDIKKMIEVTTFDIIYQLPKDELSLPPFQAAIYLGVSTSVLQSWRKKNEGPEWYRKEGKILYPSAGIKIFVKRSTFVHDQIMKKLNKPNIVPLPSNNQISIPQSQE